MGSLSYLPNSNGMVHQGSTLRAVVLAECYHRWEQTLKSSQPRPLAPFPYAYSVPLQAPGSLLGCTAKPCKVQ
jgi:hypothetical protein